MSWNIFFSILLFIRKSIYGFFDPLCLVGSEAGTCHFRFFRDWGRFRPPLGLTPWSLPLVKFRRVNICRRRSIRECTGNDFLILPVAMQNQPSPVTGISSLLLNNLLIAKYKVTIRIYDNIKYMDFYHRSFNKL